MKEKFLFVVGCEVDPGEKTGVAVKIFNQKRVLEKYFDVYLVGFSKDGVFFSHGDSFEKNTEKNRRKARIELCKKICKDNGITKCFSRGGALEPYTVMLFKALKKLGVNVAMEIPTYPYDKELQDNIKHKILLQCDRALRKVLGRYVDRIVTYSDDEKIFGIPCINLLNGIDVFGQTYLKNKKESDTIHMIGVAKVSDWHGFDRLIEGLANYNGSQKVVFDLVGAGPALNVCQEIVKAKQIEDKVVFHGFKSGKELEEVYSTADLGIDCLGLHRKGLTRVSSLKSREYAAKGLPIVAANKFDEILDDWKYIINVSADESPVDIEFILGEFNCLKTETNYREQIRRFAENNFDITATFMPVVDYFLKK